MIKSIDEAACVNCGICENICPMDVFRRDNKEQVYIAYPGDCSTCMFCSRFCPVNAITVTPGIAKKYDVSQKWERVKEMMGVEPVVKPNAK